MGGWNWLFCGRSKAGGGELQPPEPFQLPAPLPEWPQGLGLFSLSPSAFPLLAFHLLFVLIDCGTSSRLSRISINYWLLVDLLQFVDSHLVRSFLW